MLQTEPSRRSSPACLLRVRFAAPATETAAQAWALCDAHGRVQRSGFDAPATWPDADAAEAIVAAALLHDVIEDTHATTREIKDAFGDAVTKLVDGMTMWK